LTYSDAPGPVVNALQPTVRIASVDAKPVPVPPASDFIGALAQIDVTVDAPGAIPVVLATTGVPEGTSVELSAKRRTGPSAVAATGTLQPANCDAAGPCPVTISPNLPPGAYFLEARAKFTPDGVATPQRLGAAHPARHPDRLELRGGRVQERP